MHAILDSMQRPLPEQIGNGFGGAEVAKVRRDGSEIRVLVQNAQENRDTLADLMQTQIA